MREMVDPETAENPMSSQKWVRSRIRNNTGIWLSRRAACALNRRLLLCSWFLITRIHSRRPLHAGWRMLLKGGYSCGRTLKDDSVSSINLNPVQQI